MSVDLENLKDATPIKANTLNLVRENKQTGVAFAELSLDYGKALVQFFEMAESGFVAVRLIAEVRRRC